MCASRQTRQPRSYHPFKRRTRKPRSFHVAAHIGGDARVAHDQGRSLTAIDVSACGDSERRLFARLSL
jgi:hypothetical protein